MKSNLLSVQEKIVIVRQYKNIGITSRLRAYYIPNAEPVPPRFYNGRIIYQYKTLRVGLTTLRKQPRCRIVIAAQKFLLPF